MRNNTTCSVSISPHCSKPEPPDEPEPRPVSSIPFAGIIDIIEPLLKQRPSCGAVFFCRHCRLMFSAELARRHVNGQEVLVCPNHRYHDEMLAAPLVAAGHSRKNENAAEISNDEIADKIIALNDLIVGLGRGQGVMKNVVMTIIVVLGVTGALLVLKSAPKPTPLDYSWDRFDGAQEDVQ
ncbi:MAG: hypothetical protein WAZ27_00390 [Minisyncoccia bacterium]